MALTQFATADELAIRMGRTFDATEEAQADALLDDASNIIRSHVGLDFNKVEDDTVILYGTGDSRLYLPQAPIVGVSAVQLNDVTLGADADYSVTRDYLFRRSGWGCSTDDITVTYTHGADDVPPLVKLIALQIACRVFSNPGGVKSTALGEYSVTYNSATDVPGIALTEAEMRALDALKRRVPSVRLERGDY